MPIVEFNGYLMVFEHYKGSVTGYTIFKGHLEGNAEPEANVPDDILDELHRRAEAKLK